MTDDEEPGTESVSAHYREVATEKPPATLDRAVLARSRNAAKSKTAVFRGQAWYRPAIFVGLVGLTLSLILEVTGPDATRPPASDIGGAFDDVLNEASRQARDAESRAEASMRNVPSSSDPLSAAEPSPGSDTNLGEKSSCSEEERGSASTWWQCIEELERAGQHDAAESELRQLLENFPDFSLPKTTSIRNEE
jgi:hypothetical protein